MFYRPQRKMLKGFAVKKSILAMSGVLMVTAGAVNVTAQEAPEKAEPSKQIALEEIVVTGTLIRGVEATGAQTIGIDRENIIDSGASTVNELLASLPQVSNFFNQRPEQDPRGAARNTLNRPNLRNLPGVNETSGAVTLVLVDGHRMAPMGVQQSSFDPDMLPSAVIERVEVVTDGGSSLYGADAVGGVINFITKKEFDGVELDMGYDFSADDYSSWNTSLTGGTSWERGSGYISLSTNRRDNVVDSDIDWAEGGEWNADGTVLSPSESRCIAPVGTVTTYGYAGAFGWVVSPFFPGTGTVSVGQKCDTGDWTTYLPEQERDHLFGSLTQELADGVTLDVKSYWGEKTLTLGGYPLGDTVSGANPNDLGLTPATAGGIYYPVSSLGFSYGAHPAYVNHANDVSIETWGITPELTIDMANGWQLRNTVHYGYSDNISSTPGVNRPLQLQAVADGLLNPANIAAANGALVTDILDWNNYQQSRQEMFLFRSVADGAIMDLPAGEMRAAVGIEVTEDRAKLRLGDVAISESTSLTYKEDSRNVQSLFGELSIPVMTNLDLSLSARYDDYSDFGDTANPTIGLTYTPVEWVKLYGHWGESFNAPTVLDRLGQGRILGLYPGVAFIVPDGGQRDPTRNDALLAEGTGGLLLPQTAETWAMGFEIEPVESLEFTANYYEIDFVDLLGSVNPQSTQSVQLNPDKFIFNPTQADLDDFLAQMANGGDFPDINVNSLGVIVDRRVTNTDQAQLKGIDFGVNYVHDTNLGSLSYGLNGNYQTEFILTQNGTDVDQLEFNNPDLTLAGTVGWSRDNIRASLTLKYTDGFNTDQAVNQSSVDSFLVTDLFVGYDFAGGSMITDGLSLRLNVDNLLDEEPPEFRRSGQPNYAGWTLGRVFKLGFTKTFN